MLAAVDRRDEEWIASHDLAPTSADSKQIPTLSQ
jgi:hypothetical protein